MEFYAFLFACYLMNLTGAALLGPAQIGVVHTEHSGFLVPPHIHQVELRNQGPHFESNTGFLSHSSGQTATAPLQGAAAAGTHKATGSTYSGGTVGSFVSSGDSGRRLSLSADALVTPGSQSGDIFHSKIESVNKGISSFPASSFAANADVPIMPTSFGLLQGSVSTNEDINGRVLLGKIGGNQGSFGTSIGSGINSNFEVKTLKYPSESHSLINEGSTSCTSAGKLGCSSEPLKPENANIRLGSANFVSDGIHQSMIHETDGSTGEITEADIRLGLAGLENDHLTGRISTGIDKTPATRGYVTSPGSARVDKPTSYTGSAHTPSSGSLSSIASSSAGSNFGSHLGRLITPGSITFESNVFGSDGGSMTGAFHGSAPSKSTGNSSPLIGVTGGLPGSISTSHSGSKSSSDSKSYGGLSGSASFSNGGSEGGSLSGLIGTFPASIGAIDSGSSPGSISKINHGSLESMYSKFGGNNAGFLTVGFLGYPGSISSSNSESNAGVGGHANIHVTHASSEANSNAGVGYEEFSGY